MFDIVDDLIFVRDRSLALFGDEVLHPAVAARCHDPFETKVEVVKGVDRDDVAAVGRRLATAGEMLQAARFDDPALGGEAGFLETAPSRGGGAVEQQFPSSIAYGRGQPGLFGG